MYCPLCKAEYRQGFHKCNDCCVDLVSTREEADNTAVSLLWSGGDESQLDGILDSLKDAHIPFNLKTNFHPETAAAMGVVAGARVLLGGLLPPSSQRDSRTSSGEEWEIRVLTSQYDIARAAVGRAASEGKIPLYCPECKAEYQHGITECAACGVALVDALGAVDGFHELGDAASKDMRPVWRGGSEEDAEKIRALLEAEKVPSIIGVYEPKLIRGMNGPTYWVAVRKRDEEQAQAKVNEHEQARQFDELPDGPPSRTLARDATMRNPLSLNRPTWGFVKSHSEDAISGQDEESAVDAEENYPATPADQAPEDLSPNSEPAEIQAEDTLAEIWSGESREAADFLKICLRENNIAFTIRNESGKLHISVEASDVPRAKEIVREIAEGSTVE